MDGDFENIDSDVGILQLVTFKLRGEEFAIEILSVQEIIRIMQITIVPRTPDFIEGVINLRGKVIPVLDLRKRFGMEEIERDSQTRIIVMEFGEKIVGFLVDGVSEVLRIPADTMEDPPSVIASGVGAEYIKGVGKLNDRLLILLDLDGLMNNTELNFDKVA